MSSETFIDPTRVVLKLRTLALSPSNRAVICRRGVPASLVQFINQNPPGSQVTALAIETLYLLSEEESNVQLLASEPNLLSSIQNTFSAIRSEHGNHSSSSSSKTSSAEKAASPHDTEDEFVQKMRKNLEYHCEELLKRLQPQSRGGGGHTFSSSFGDQQQQQQQQNKEKIRKKHTVQFQVENLVQNRKAIEKVLLKNSGTISYKFNIEGDYVSVYTRSKTENLIAEISQFGRVTVLQDAICETEYNSENLFGASSSGGGGGGASSGSGAKRPEYLKKDVSSGGGHMSDYKKSLVSVSREDRLKKRKEAHTSKSGSSGSSSTSSSSSSSAASSTKKASNEEESGGFLKKLTSVFW